MYQYWFTTYNTRSRKNIFKHIKNRHFIFLQEIEELYFNELVNEFNSSDKKTFFYSCFNNDKGVISVFPIISSVIEKMNVGYGTEDSFYFSLTVNLAQPNMKLTQEDERSYHLKVLCLELDKNSEKTRLEQLLHIKDIDKHHVIMGCLNSLYFADYTPAKMDLINEQRINNQKEVPENNVINFLKDMNFSLNPFTIPTCTDGTRVDYILIKHNSSTINTVTIVENKIKNKVNPSFYHYPVSCLIFKGGINFAV